MRSVGMLFAIRISFGIAALAASSIVSAQGYIGGSLGQSSTSFNTADYAINAAGVAESQDKAKTAYKLFAGYDFTKNWAVEVGYADLGKPQYNYRGVFDVYASTKETSWFAAAKGTLPISDQFNLFGKLGWTYNKTEKSVTTSNLAAYVAFNGVPPPPNMSKTRGDVLFGIGAEYVATKNIALRLEYEDFGKFGSSGAGSTGSTKTNLWTIGLGYKF